MDFEKQKPPQKEKEEESLSQTLESVKITSRLEKVISDASPEILDEAIKFMDRKTRDSLMRSIHRVEREIPFA